MSEVLEKVACIDLEGVLVPEMWPYIAQRTGIDVLHETTREVPEYRLLMARRISALRSHGVTLPQMQEILAEIAPFPESTDFLARIGEQYSVRILSDCFYELADPVLGLLGRPTALCHHLVTDDDGFIVRCEFAPSRRGKEDVVAAFLDTGSEVVAVGDAFNDLEMLKLATRGFLVRPSESTRAMASSRICVVEHVDEIVEMLR